MDARLAVLVLIAVVGLSFVPPSAGAHAGAAIELEAREGEACVNQPVCLELVSLPPDLEPGHRTGLELRVHPEATGDYGLAVAAVENADPDRRNTSTADALARLDPVGPGQTARGNLTTPDAAHVYAWLPGGDHEQRGGHELVPLGGQTDDGPPAREDASVGPTGTVLALLGASMAAWRRARP